MRVDPSVSLAAIRSAYRAACAASNAIITSIGDASAAVTRGGKIHDLRWAILSVLQETAQPGRPSRRPDFGAAGRLAHSSDRRQSLVRPSPDRAGAGTVDP
jgi:hypothetical protein